MKRTISNMNYTNKSPNTNTNIEQQEDCINALRIKQEETKPPIPQRPSKAVVEKIIGKLDNKSVSNQKYLFMPREIFSDDDEEEECMSDDEEEEECMSDDDEEEEEECMSDDEEECMSNEMDKAIREGHLEVVQYLHSIGQDCTTRAMNEASAGGHLEVVKYLHSIEKDCTTRAMDEASAGGHTGVVQYLNSIGKECTTRAMNDASDGGHLEVVKFLHSIEKDCTSCAMDWASHHGHVEVVKFLHSIGKDCTSRAMNWASQHGHLEVVKFLHFVGKDCTHNAIDFAFGNGHHEVGQYLISVGYEKNIYKNLFQYILKADYYDMIQIYGEFCFNVHPHILYTYLHLIKNAEKELVRTKKYRVSSAEKKFVKLYENILQDMKSNKCLHATTVAHETIFTDIFCRYTDDMFDSIAKEMINHCKIDVKWYQIKNIIKACATTISEFIEETINEGFDSQRHLRTVNINNEIFTCENYSFNNCGIFTTMMEKYVEEDGEYLHSGIEDEECWTSELVSIPNNIINKKSPGCGGHIYLVDTMNGKEKYKYKIGRSVNVNNRIKSYGKNSRLLFETEVNDFKIYENNIKHVLRDTEGITRQGSTEYFNCESEIYILNIVSILCDISSFDVLRAC